MAGVAAGFFPATALGAALATVFLTTVFAVVFAAGAAGFLVTVVLALTLPVAATFFLAAAFGTDFVVVLARVAAVFLAAGALVLDVAMIAFFQDEHVGERDPGWIL